MNNAHRNIHQKIGKFFLEKNNNDYSLTEDQIRRLGITHVFITMETVVIVLRRPGLIIGKKGETIQNLSKYLDMKIHIVEETAMDVNDLIIPVDYQEDFT